MLLILATVFAASLEAAYAPPTGTKRVEADAFGQWLRRLPLAPVDQPIRTYDGRIVPHRGRVVELPLVPGDLQQCADSLIRLRAQWRKERGEPVLFHATSGDPLPWARWQRGERPYLDGQRLAWRPGTRGGWESYLKAVFTWAGTLSLAAYDTTPAQGPPRPGDLLVDPGSPGHAALLLDVATGGGQTYVLIGEGYMPAQSFHVEHGPHGGWWLWDGGVTLPHWDLHGEEVHRRFIR